jgi:hypothetical protein
MSIFSSVSESMTMATLVTSEPVPAVVGMHTIGNPAGATLGTLKRLSGPPCSASTAMALAESMAEPPPNPTMASAPSSRDASTPSTSDAVVGSGTAPSKVAWRMLADESASCTGSSTPVRDKNLSVTSNGRRQPSAAKTSGRCRDTPDPMRMKRGIAIVAIAEASLHRDG